MKIINERRSVRSFLDTAVNEEAVEAMLRAAMQAPSAGNQQPWEFVVVTDQTTREQLAAMSPYTAALNSSPVAIIILAKKEGIMFSGNVPQDLGAATQNLLLEAVNQGLGAVWLGIQPEQDRMDLVSQILNLPDHVSPFAAIAIGHPTKENANTFVDRFDPDRIHRGQY